MLISKLNRLVIIVIVVTVFFAILPSSVFAVDAAPRITDKEIIKELSDIRGDIKRLETEIKRVEAEMKIEIKRLEDGQGQMREEMNQRFDDMKWFLGIMIGTLLVINTGVLGYVLKRQGYMEKSLETIKDELIFLKGIVEKLLPPRGVL